jgi:DNA mismatch repair protein MutL
MTAQETRLALLRHATSKIVSPDDLWGLTTFGFRGEALPSIAAVSRLILRTKRPGSTAGFSLGYEAGIETSSGDVGMPDGTQIEVRDLFWNTPARLKFMKSEATEVANVSEAVIRLALAHPEIHFRLRGNGRVVLDLPPHRDMGERVRAALARRGASLLHEAQGEEAGVVVRAFLAAPEEASATPRSTFLFVGKRFVRDRSLLHALAMGYGEVLEKGRYPMAALFVDVPGQELDVNVHPQKLEVRFARAQEVYGAVRHVVGAAVARAPWLPPAPLRAYTLPPEKLDAPVDAASEATGPAQVRSESRGWQAPLRSVPQGRPRGLAHTVEGLELPREAPSQKKEESSPAGVPEPPAAAGGFFGSLEYIGQVHRTYLICESHDELVIAPVHATLASFEKGLRESDPEIAPSQIYAYAALKCRVPYANGAPNLTVDTPALLELAKKNEVPLAGKDFKTGQTFMKTIISPGLKARLLGIDGWYSTNILGNRDGEVLDDPESHKTKEMSKLGALEHIMQPSLYPDLYGKMHHVVRINYYPPRGDNKEGWDNIDIFGWMGYPMQIKINFLCRDSILAAPIVLDLALFMDLAQRSGLSGVQEWLSFYWKSPMTPPNVYPEHDTFIQLMKLKNTLRYLHGEELITHLGAEYYD